VFERGALVDSWFFDKNGFNADSSSYEPQNWNSTRKDFHDVKNFCSRALEGSEALEAQGPRQDLKQLRQYLNCIGKKILFVPLQRPNDTVIQFFMPHFSSYDRFVGFLDEVGRNLSEDWTIIVKQHPLEVCKPRFSTAQLLPDDIHFLDALKLCDAVALVNSGVGIYSIMANKPTYVFGRSFYNHEEITWSYGRESAKEVAEVIQSGYKMNRGAALKFINFLINDFYSFGTSNTYVSRENNGKKKSATDGIDFYTLRLPAQSVMVRPSECSLMVTVDLETSSHLGIQKERRHSWSSLRLLQRKARQIKRNIHKRIAALF
jgi:hypothetical protein